MSQIFSVHSHTSKHRLGWLEGIRVLAAVSILLYHAQLLFSDYAYYPKPEGLLSNLSALLDASHSFGQSAFAIAFALPIWFGFQAVDVFILIAGFVLVLSLRRKPHAPSPGKFIWRRLLRILWPFWTVAWLAYPVLWLIGVATNSYRPAPWDVFAGATFPLLFDFEGKNLLNTSGPWWFIPLATSFALVSPVLWYLLKRWGAKNLLLVSLVVTVLYRFWAVYYFGGHLTYTLMDTPTGWTPFVSFLSKLSTFVVGMAAADAYCNRRGPLYWRPRQLVMVGGGVYIAGFVAQFYRAGWVVCDLLLPVGLVMCGFVFWRSLLSTLPFLSGVLRWLAPHSYSFFLIHGFVIDRTIHLWVRGSFSRYWLSLPLMIVGTLVLAIAADAARPFAERIVLHLWRDLDHLLSLSPTADRASWLPAVGDHVGYQRSRDWTVIKVETLLDEGEVSLCQISDAHRTMWVSANTLRLMEPEKAVRMSDYSNIKTVV